MYVEQILKLKSKYFNSSYLGSENDDITIFLEIPLPNILAAYFLL